MTWSYTGDPSSSDKDTVRFLIGDTDTSSEQLSDEEIAYLITEHGSAQAAAIAGCEALQAKYARQADQKTGDISISYSQLSKHYQQLATTIRNRLSILATPYAGGISYADRETDNTDTDRVDPAFEVGGMDNEPRPTLRKEWESS